MAYYIDGAKLMRQMVLAKARRLDHKGKMRRRLETEKKAMEDARNRAKKVVKNTKKDLNKLDKDGRRLIQTDLADLLEAINTAPDTEELNSIRAKYERKLNHVKNYRGHKKGDGGEI